MKVEKARRLFFKWIMEGFSGGSMVKNPPVNAGQPKFDPWCGKTPYASEQLSPCVATTEPASGPQRRPLLTMWRSYWACALRPRRRPLLTMWCSYLACALGPRRHPLPTMWLRYWACVLGPQRGPLLTMWRNYWSLCALEREEPPQREAMHHN